MQLMADALARVAERALADDAAESTSSDRFQVVRNATSLMDRTSTPPATWTGFGWC